MFFLENHWEIDTISGIVIASLEYRSVPKICSDYRILSLDVRIARAAVALRHQQLDGRWFWVSCYIVLIISKCVVAISLEDLGRSWKILDPWSVKPNHKTIFNITILMGIWWYHPQSASVMVGRFMAPRPAAHVQRAGCRWPKHPLNLRGR